MEDEIRYGFTIETRYHGPTDYRGARISARLTDAKQRHFRPVFINYPHELSGRDVHAAAARELIKQWDAAREEGAFLPLKIIGSGGSDRGYIFFAA